MSSTVGGVGASDAERNRGMRLDRKNGMSDTGGIDPLPARFPLKTAHFWTLPEREHPRSAWESRHEVTGTTSELSGW